MLDEEPIAGEGQPDGEGEPGTGSEPTPASDDRQERDDAEMTAALLREPEVGEGHAATPDGPDEPAEAEAAAPTLEPDANGAPVARPRGLRRRVPLAIGAVVLAVALGAGGAFVALPHAAPTPLPSATPLSPATIAATPTAAPSTASPGPSEAEATPTTEPTEVVLSPDAGKVAFADDFAGKNVGWPAASTGLTTLSMSTGAYVVGGKAASTDHLVEAPYEPRLQQIAVTATATQSAGKGTAGFGVTCGGMTTPVAQPSLPAEASLASAPAGSQEILFEFVVLSNGGWLIARRDGPPARSVQPVVLMHGTTASVPGPRPLTVSGICASAPGGSRTRLILIIGGLRVMDFSDVSATVTEGWRGGLVVSTVDVKASVAFRHVEIRDLSGP